MTARAYRIILLVVLSLAFAAFACVGGRGGGGRGSYEATKAAIVQECLEATYGAEQFHAQLTAMGPQK